MGACSCSSASMAYSPSNTESCVAQPERPRASSRGRGAKSVEEREATSICRVDARATMKQLRGCLKLPPPQLGCDTICEMKEVTVGGRKAPSSIFRVPDYMGFVRKLGAGAYGNVAAFADSRTGGKVAVKKVTSAFDDLQDGKRILREVKLLRQFDHANIIRILDMCPPESPSIEDIYIVTDLMETDLSRVIRSQQPLLESHHQLFTQQILLALRYLHRRGVIHRDLKPANILVNSDCELKICDFGLARVPSVSKTTNPLTEYVVTRWYRAPEVTLAESQYTDAIDVWSVGCILSELINRQPLFEGKDPTDQIKKIIGTIGYPSSKDLQWLPKGGVALRFLEQVCPKGPPANWARLLPSSSNAAREAVMAMLRFDPSTRATAHEALQLPYFHGLEGAAEAAAEEASEVMDWSFDDFEPTKAALQGLIYCECANFHPEIVQRDQVMLKGLGLLHEDAIEASPAGFAMADEELN